MATSYSDEQKGNALLALKANAGNVRKTADQTGIPRGTLRSWASGKGVTAKAEKHAEKSAAKLADSIEEVARAILAKILTSTASPEADIQKLATSFAILVDKMLLVNGQPTAISQQALSPEERDERLARIRDRVDRLRAQPTD